MIETLRKIMFAGVGAAYMTKEKAEDLVNEMIEKGEIEKKEKTQKVRELMDKAEEKVKEFSGFVEAQVQKAVEKVRSAERKDIEALRREVADLKAELRKQKNA